MDEQEARAELEGLRRALETRPVIDQARGVLMGSFQCSADEAWAVLRSVSQHTNIKLHVVAEQIMASTQGEPVAATIRAQLHEQLRAYGKTSLPPAG